jgi:23S rRNA (uracil1939-C5)-methyltransferase
MPERADLTITRLGAQGDGIADTPSGPVFVARTLPGERITAIMEADRGRLIEVITPSPDRVAPTCPHFATCGGCIAQHMAGDLYHRWKRDLVVTAFAHRGLEPPVAQAVAVPPGRRRRATFAAVRRNRETVLGFHEEGTHTLVPITSCPVMLPAIEAALPALREIADAVLVAPVDKADKVRLAVTATADGLDVLLIDAPARIGPEAQARIAAIAGGAGIVRVTSREGIVMQRQLPRLDIGGAVVTLPPGAFIQATAEAETAVAAILADATRKARRIADLFCGLGTFSFGLARRARVLAVDGDKAAVATLAAAAKSTPGIRPIETKIRDLMHEPLSRTELADFDAVVFDPPRAGAKAQAEMLARSKVPVVCAISCNPATLARDCRILVDAGYAIERVVPIDQFVWSPHVEAVAVLRRG